MSTGPAEKPTVDVHAHILLPALQQLVAEADPEGFGAQQALEIRRNGPESMAASGKMIKERWPQLTDLDRRLADMDAQGVDVQLVSPSLRADNNLPAPDRRDRGDRCRRTSRGRSC